MARKSEWAIQTWDFRAKKPYVSKDKDGCPIKITECEERVAGRWEGFVIAARAKEDGEFDMPRVRDKEDK